jgi:hypothetical protein
MNNQNGRNNKNTNKNKKNLGDDFEVKEFNNFKYSSNSRLDDYDLGIASHNSIFSDLFCKTFNENEITNTNLNSRINKNMNNTAVNMNMKHQPTRMNYDMSQNFPNKVSRSITEDDDKEENIIQNKKHKSGSYVPWKRAEIDPRIVTKGTEIHLNPIPHNINHEEIYKLFKLYGEIIHIRIIPRKDKGNSFCFIRFLDKQSAEKALNDRTININVISSHILYNRESQLE